MEKIEKTKRYTHLTMQDIVDAREIEEATQGLDNYAKRLILERIKGMKEMQEIMSVKTA